MRHFFLGTLFVCRPLTRSPESSTFAAPGHVRMKEQLLCQVVAKLTVHRFSILSAHLAPRAYFVPTRKKLLSLENV